MDASRKANLGSSLSHSCNSNCYTEVRVCVQLTARRYIALEGTEERLLLD